MVGPINSNRPVQMPANSARNDADVISRGKSQMSVGHQAKEQLLENTINHEVDVTAPNAMGKLASMIAQMKIVEEQIPDVSPESVVVEVEAAIVTVIEDPQPVATDSELSLDLLDGLEEDPNDPMGVENILDQETDET